MAAEMDKDFLERATQVYRDLSKIPSLINGKIIVHGDERDSTSLEATITSKWTQRDLERNETRTFQRNHYLNYKESGTTLKEPNFPVELQQIQLMSISPSKKIQVIIRKISGSKKDEDKQFIEIWSFNNMLNSIDIKTADKHGKIYEDSQFGCLQWSPSEKYVLYVAEKKKPKSVSYFEKIKEADDADCSSSKTPSNKGDQFVYEEDWGEQLVKKHHPTLAILDVDKGDIRVIDGIPDHLSVGQALWGPGESGVVFSGWWHDPYRLGLTYCTNRRSGIFYILLDGTYTGFEQLSSPGDAIISPRFNPQMDQLVYVARDVVGVHMCCMKLVQYDWKTKTTSIVIDFVDQPGDDSFPGLYLTALPERCWSSDGTQLIFMSFWRSSMHILVVDVPKKSVTRLTKENGCWNVLDVQKNFILASFSSPSVPHKLMLAALPSRPGDTDLDWITIAEPKPASQDMKWEIITLTPDDKEEGYNKDYEAVLIKPSNPESENIKPPLIVFPHGGPHTVYCSGYMIYVSGLCRLGFAVLLVNYKGSIGFGKKSLESLLGRIGTQDIAEVRSAAFRALERGDLDDKNVYVMGGSHGGFIGSHLIGQYPDMFRASVLRNPVINVASMVGTSDIPDWCFEENALDFNYELVPDAETYAKLLASSPIIHAKKVVTPTLLMLGEEDRRVPPSQGKEFYKILKTRGVEVRLLVYPDNSHPLNKVEAESDAFVNIARWFHGHRVKA